MKKHFRTRPLLTSPAGEEPRHSVKSLSTSHSPSRKCPPLQGRVGVGFLAMRYYPDKCYATAMRYFHEDIEQTRGLLPALKECGYKERNRIITINQLKIIEEYLGEP